MAQRARQGMPNSPDIMDTLGWIYLKKNLSDDAVRTFRELIVADPNRAAYHYHYGMALLQKGDKPSAKTRAGNGDQVQPLQGRRREDSASYWPACRRTTYLVSRSPAVPYVAPFVVFLALIGLSHLWPMPALADEIFRLAVMLAVLFLVARPVLDFRVQQWGVSVLVGVADLRPVDRAGSAVSALPAFLPVRQLRDGYRAKSSLTEAARHDVPVLFLRTLRAVVIVPIVEELFWRGWLMRWMIDNDFEQVPLGAYSATVVLGGGAAVCERTWSILGRGPGGGNPFQLVDDPHQEPGRSDFGARGRQRLLERVRDRGGKMGILALTQTAQAMEH